MKDDTQSQGGDSCEDCPIAPRRQFLRELGGMAAVALITLGAAPAEAAALGWRLAARRVRRGETKQYPIPAADGVTIDADESVIVARYKGAAYAFSLACPHQNTALKWIAGDQEFRCPKHHSEYTPTGEFIDGRATRGMDRFAVTRADDKLVVNLDALFREDDDPKAWQAAFISL